MSESEAQVEKYLHKCIEEFGGITRKWVSPQHSGVPDRILFHPNRCPFFIEVKRKRKLPKPHQWREIMRLQKMGAVAGYLAGVEEVDIFMKAYENNEFAAEEWLRRTISENIPENILNEIS